ncbi:ap-4 complex subunit beta-1 [Anaeramoeba flamelloides]|uniref:AP complex subunit beta n=1 Tax=Anaeramoeba flamelloides TaxID=1746091 RepID=A0ABQ8ZFA1_9EUKA|nr:ap-4 complex subunit beta-1 [Anaeramoeba flamelloides]
MSNFDLVEINRIKELMKNVRIKDTQKRKKLICKVIDLMNQGADVSSLLPEMIKASQTTDLAQKKLINLFLLTYSSKYPKTALMTVNTFIKDTVSKLPSICGLAIRSMSSLNNPELLKLIMPHVLRSLNDHSSYVRSIAIISLIKLWKVIPESLNLEEINYTLYELLLDNDPQVLLNSIQAINTIFHESGGIAINSKIISHFLNRLTSLSDWGLGVVFGLISKYAPENEKESLLILNRCDDFLRHENSFVVLSAAKVLVNIIEDLPNLKIQHIKLIAKQLPQLFYKDYTRFFLQRSDLSYQTNVKLDILSEIVSSTNVQPIIEELSEYVINSEMNQDLSRRAIVSLSKIAIKFPKYCQSILQSLIAFLDLEIDYIIEESIIVMKNILQILPTSIEMIKNYISQISKLLINNDSNSESKSSLIWICGQFGNEIEKSPYILESLILDFDKLESRSKLELLSSTVNLFCIRPAECQLMLGKLLQLSIEDQNNVDVLDRALFYYRILETGIENAKLIVSKNFSPEKITFQEKDDEQLTETLLDEYNSLSIVYEKPYSQITHNYRILNQEKSDESESESESESENENQNENEKEWG